MKRRIKSSLLSLLVLLCTLFGAACSPVQAPPASNTAETAAPQADHFEYAAVPAYAGEPYAVINGNQPFFTEEDMAPIQEESYAELDDLGRCGVAMALVSPRTMPTSERGSIGMVRPSGWQTVRYSFVDGQYLYNRCHLIGYQLTAENANTQNLITGTCYLNTEGMLPFENQVASYVEGTGRPVLYRVTPVFIGEELVARGVLMEALSTEDGGDGVRFCVFCYNVQPGVAIDYTDGSSTEAKTGPQQTNEAGLEYILNTNTKKFHKPDCQSAQDMSETNKQTFTGSREWLIDQGYEPCQRCQP